MSKWRAPDGDQCSEPGLNRRLRGVEPYSRVSLMGDVPELAEQAPDRVIRAGGESVGAEYKSVW